MPEENKVIFAIDDEIDPDCVEHEVAKLAIWNADKYYIDSAKVVDVNPITQTAIVEVEIVTIDGMEDELVTVEIPFSKLQHLYEPEDETAPFSLKKLILKGMITIGILGLMTVGLALYKHLNG